MNSTASHFWSSFNGQMLIELVGGIIGALIFLFIVLLAFKPKLKVAKILCRVNNTATYYLFKFVNVSFFPAHDIKVELYRVTKLPMSPNLFNVTYEPLTLVASQISHIPGRTFFWKKRPHNPHCITVRSREDLNAILSNPFNLLVLKISLKHGLTGLAKVYEQEYVNESDIKNGKFKPGTKFDVI